MITSRLLAGLLLFLFFALLILPCSSIAAAENQEGVQATPEFESGYTGPYYKRSGVYMVVTASYDYASEFASSMDVPGLTADNAFGINARLGYKYQELGLELQGEYLPSHDVEVDGSHVGSYSTTIITFNLKYWIPFRRFQPYFLLGLGWGYETSNLISGDSASNSAGRIGVGMDFYLTEHLALNTESSVVFPNTKGIKFDYSSVALGLMYKF